MRVVTRGTPEAERYYRVTCTSCRSVIEYKHTEILRVIDDQRTGITHNLGNCPVCGKSLYNYFPRAMTISSVTDQYKYSDINY